MFSLVVSRLIVREPLKALTAISTGLFQQVPMVVKQFYLQIHVHHYHLLVLRFPQLHFKIILRELLTSYIHLPYKCNPFMTVTNDQSHSLLNLPGRQKFEGRHIIVKPTALHCHTDTICSFQKNFDTMQNNCLESIQFCRFIQQFTCILFLMQSL